MTNEELIKKYKKFILGAKETIAEYGNKYNMDDTKKDIEEYELIVSALEKQSIIDKSSDKYRWHDLRENPEDLPKDDNCVLACCCLRGKKYYGVFNYIDPNWEDGVNPPNLVNYFVIAWKEIESFVDEYIFPDNSDHRKQRGRTAPNWEDDLK